MIRAEFMKKELKYRETIKYLKRDLKQANSEITQLKDYQKSILTHPP